MSAKAVASTVTERAPSETGWIWGGWTVWDGRATQSPRYHAWRGCGRGHPWPHPPWRPPCRGLEISQKRMEAPRSRAGAANKVRWTWRSAAECGRLRASRASLECVGRVQLGRRSEILRRGVCRDAIERRLAEVPMCLSEESCERRLVRVCRTIGSCPHRPGWRVGRGQAKRDPLPARAGRPSIGSNGVEDRVLQGGRQTRFRVPC